MDQTHLYGTYETKKNSLGRCKLGGFESGKSPIHKSDPYFNTWIEKIVKNQCWMGLMWWLIN